MQEKTKKKLARIEKLRATMDTLSACKKVGMNHSMYYRIRQEQGGKRATTPRPVVLTAPELTPSDTFTLQGSPELIARFVKEMARG